MTLRGVGVDIASIARIGSLVERYGMRFVTRWFDPSEVDELGPQAMAVGLAGRFAVKEAVWKALGLDPPGPLAWRHIIVNAVPGRPGDLSVRLQGSLAARARALGVGSITATTTAFGDAVVAVALIETAPG